MNIQEQVQSMDDMILQGDILKAVNTFFGENATTSDYGNVSTKGKAQMVEKMEGFLGAIAQVNGIEHHRSLIDGPLSASEFTFDFDMKDGSRIYWHEIIRRIWNDEGKVTREDYFDAKKSRP